MKFDKGPLQYAEQAEKLIARGMLLKDKDRVAHYLEHLNYYRLAAYWLPFEQDHSTHKFKPGTSFDTVLEHYIFDRELRLLVMDAVERLEVSLRAHWAYHLAHTYGPHAHLNPSLFKPNGKYAENLEKLTKDVSKSSEVFIRHFVKVYDEGLPPVWAVCEIMTLGQLSNWYSNLRHSKDRNAISRVYDFDEVNLASFLHHLTTVRNFCAHHSRLWNRELTVGWKIPFARPVKLLPNLRINDGKRIYNTLATLMYLMDIINPRHHLKKRLIDLFDHHKAVEFKHMGFDEKWRDLPLWKIT